MGKVRLAKSPQPIESQDRNFREDLMRILKTDLTDLFRRQEEAPLVDDADTRLAGDVVRDAVRERATDIHIDPQSEGARVRLRVDGRVLDTVELTDGQFHRIVNQVKTLADIDPVKTFEPVDARFTYELDQRLIDVRIAIVPSVVGPKLAIRLLDPVRARQSIAQLGLSEDDEQELKDWLDATSGMFLVTGPTGSGKTTLLYALLHELRTHDWSVCTIEDPVEYQIDGITQIQVDSRHGLTFPKGLKTMLRLDPDFLMVGEVRDPESARSAIDASIAGRALMTTLHSRDAVSALSALRNWGATDLEIAVSLSCVVASRLVRTLCPQCKKARQPNDKERRWADLGGIELPDEVFDADGCSACHDLGFKGRTGVFETWKLDEEDYNALLTGVDERAMRRQLANKGHRTLIADGLDKARAGMTSVPELAILPDIVLPAAYRGDKESTDATEAAAVLSKSS